MRRTEPRGGVRDLGLQRGGMLKESDEKGRKKTDEGAGESGLDCELGECDYECFNEDKRRIKRKGKEE